VDTSRVVQLPPPIATSTENLLADVTAAIELVAQGGARRVILSGLSRPEDVAADALVVAQGAGVDFKLERNEATGAVSVLIGPLAR
jgi:hypothetical protein